MAQLHEYQGKAILAANGFNILRFGIGAEAEADFGGVVHVHVVVRHHDHDVFGEHHPAHASEGFPKFVDDTKHIRSPF